MRDIKFRAWAPGLKQMMYLADPVLCFADVSEGQRFGWFFKAMGETFDMSGYSAVMQFTGLKDKNGREIYDGDIIKDDNSVFFVEWEFAKWHFQRISGSYQYPSEYSNASRMEVIGNIYENPDLIEKGKV